MIVGVYGYQRSGKTLLAMILARRIAAAFGVEIYSNMVAAETHLIERLTDIPLDGRPKILLLDEVNFMVDSRSFRTNIEFTLFLNTLGKQRILLLVTAIHPGMVELRLRQQHNYVFVARGGERVFEYLCFDAVRGRRSVVTLPRSAETFAEANYDSHLVFPNLVEFNVSDFIEQYKQVREVI